MLMPMPHRRRTTAPDANTLFLCSFDGADGATSAVDKSANAHAITFGGSAQIDTAQSKFGGSSLYVPASSGVTLPNHSDWDFGTGDWTIEFWHKFQTTNLVFPTWFDSGYYGGGANGVLLQGNNSTSHAMNVYLQYVNRLAGTAYISDTNWHHHAVEVSGGTLRRYYDGAEQASVAVSDNIVSTVGPVIGATGNGSYSFAAQGWFDEFRISDIARYGGSFTPPTAPF